MQVLVVFLKDPAPGRSKSRLARTIGDQPASQVARAMLVDTLQVVRQLDADAVRVSLATATADASMAATMAKLAPDFSHEPQVGATLGERLARCFRDWFARGATRVVVIGTDCPMLDVDTIEAAFDRLRQADVVIGPASDGGYYLIGLSASDAAAGDRTTGLFDAIDWDSPRVLEQTAAAVRSKRMTLGLLPQLSDLDAVEDLQPIFGQLDAAQTAWQVRGQATYWTLFSLLQRPELVPPRRWEHVSLPLLPPVACPCGTARRGFADAWDFPATVHWTEIAVDAQPHHHEQQTECYIVHECDDDAAIELDGERRPVSVGDAILIRPDCVHRAIGSMRVIVVCIPKFDPRDEIVGPSGRTAAD